MDSPKIRHILVRHEQGAGHAAEGYAAATGRVGVCMATSGPGRHQPGHPDRRRPHGLGARSSRSPARCPARSIGTDAFQEADIRGITMPITKHNFLVTDPDDIPRAIAEAFHIAVAPAGPARCSSTSPRTCCRRRPRSAGRRSSTCPATAR